MLCLPGNTCRTVDIWNGLSEEIVAAESVHKLKEKVDKCRHGDRSLGAPLKPTHTHTHTHTTAVTDATKKTKVAVSVVP
ncbi:hypothetical protein E2C01_062868 [Portunus trituberculatus]|uniref:Uncharacterized protein n=1 Tax=Portunus trituberculatus TaxID=210409 RepID=A0A5B7HJA3_PORTR|nr:hypothetical protein [Portunus trituberculatus]